MFDSAGLAGKEAHVEWGPTGPELSEKTIAFASPTQEAVFRALEKALNSSNTCGELFAKLCSRLSRIFDINRASLAIYNPQDDFLEIPYMHVGRELKSGVTIRLAASGPLIKNVLETGRIHTGHFLRNAVANEVERKILLDRRSRSLAIIPLIGNAEYPSTFNISSGTYHAFGLLESRIFDFLFSRTARRLTELPF